MYKVRVLFFATLQDYVGDKSIELKIPSQTTIGGLTDIIISKYHCLEKVRGSMIAAINREFTANEQIITEGAEIAFFLPVSGG